MSRVLITADWHFGAPGRLRDLQWAGRVALEYCERHGIDTVLVLGDLMHDRETVGVDTYCAVYDLAAEARRRGVRVVTFPGNHDMFLKHSWAINSLRPLQEVLTLIDGVKLLELNDRRFWVLPFIHFERSYMRVLQRIVRQHQPGDSLLTHIGVRGASLNTCFLLQDWSVVDFSDTPFERVYTGHFHSVQDLDGRVFYPGSPIPFKFDEGDVPHGFYDLDLETMGHRFVNIWREGRAYFPDEPMPPQFMTLLDSQVNDLARRDVAGNMIRVVLTQHLSDDARRQLKEHLAGLGALAVRWMDGNTDPVSPVDPAPRAAAVNPGELFQRWLEEDVQGTRNLQRPLLSRLDSEIRVEGDERYVYQEAEA